MSKATLRLSDFDYQLPEELIAKYPCARRDQARLLVLRRKKSEIIHRNFSDLVDYISGGDCLVLNDTKVIWARIVGKRVKLPGGMGGGKQEILLLEKLTSDSYRVLAKPARKLTVGSKIMLADGGFSAEVLQDFGMTKIVRFSGNGHVDNLWRKLGQVPLPPYIKREPQALDQQRYQTVYAQAEGASAAPTAGLHFTKAVLAALRAKGVTVANLTLHVNYGTFAPVKCEDIAEHKMHREYFVLSRKTKDIVNATRAKGKRVFAVGTTSARVLETCADGKPPLLKEAQGWTDLFIYPPYKFKALDCLLTNFHFPNSTLLMLVSAFAGKELLFCAYQEAIKQKYRFFSYGDAMLIL